MELTTGRKRGSSLGRQSPNGRGNFHLSIVRLPDAIYLANNKPTPKLLDITLLIFCILLQLLLPQLPFPALKKLSHDLLCLRMLFGALESFECSEISCTGVPEWRDGQPWEIRRSLRRVGVWVYVWFGRCCVGGDLRDCCHCCYALSAIRRQGSSTYLYIRCSTKT